MDGETLYLLSKVQAGSVAILSTAGAPTTGTWFTGDAALDSTGALFICSAGGTPGTWTSVASQKYDAQTLAASVSLPASYTTVFTTATLAIGKWKIDGVLTLNIPVTGTSVAQCSLEIVANTATVASVVGGVPTIEVTAPTSGSGWLLPFPFTALVDVTAAGSVNINAFCDSPSGSGTAEGSNGWTGYTAILVSS